MNKPTDTEQRHEFKPHPYDERKCGRVNDKGVVCGWPRAAAVHHGECPIHGAVDTSHRCSGNELGVSQPAEARHEFNPINSSPSCYECECGLVREAPVHQPAAGEQPRQRRQRPTMTGKYQERLARDVEVTDYINEGGAPELQGEALAPETPADRDDDDLLQLLCESYGRSLLYPESKVQHDLANECRTEVLKRLTDRATPPTTGTDRIRWLLFQIISDLPSNRDWLDPDIEREAAALLGLQQVRPRPTAEAETVRHWMLKAGADQTACGQDASDLQTLSLIVEYVTCPDCQHVLTGYKFGRSHERALAVTVPTADHEAVARETAVKLVCDWSGCSEVSARHSVLADRVTSALATAARDNTPSLLEFAAALEAKLGSETGATVEQALRETMGSIATAHGAKEN